MDSISTRARVNAATFIAKRITHKSQAGEKPLLLLLSGLMNFVAETPAAYAVGYSGAASRLLAASHVGPLAPGAPPRDGGLRLAPGASLCGWRDVCGVIRCNLIAVS